MCVQNIKEPSVPGGQATSRAKPREVVTKGNNGFSHGRWCSSVKISEPENQPLNSGGDKWPVRASWQTFRSQLPKEESSKRGELRKCI